MVKSLLCALCLIVSEFARATEAGPFEFHAVADKPGVDTREYFYVITRGEAPRKVFLRQEILLDSSALRSATLEHEQDNGQPRIQIVLTEDGAKQFGEITTKFVHQPLGIVLGGQLQSAPIVNEPILGGKLLISGNFTEQQAADLVARLNASVSKPTK